MFRCNWQDTACTMGTKNFPSWWLTDRKGKERNLRFSERCWGCGSSIGKYRRFPTSRRTRTPSYSRKVPLAVSTTQHRVKLNKTWIFGDETHHRYLAGMYTCTLQRDFKIILACSDEGNRLDASACRFLFTRTVW
jgi:hypothetical protein